MDDERINRYREIRDEHLAFARLIKEGAYTAPSDAEQEQVRQRYLELAKYLDELIAEIEQARTHG